MMKNVPCDSIFGRDTEIHPVKSITIAKCDGFL